MPAKDKYDQYAPDRPIDGVRILPGSTKVIIIAPHGPFKIKQDGKPDYRNDFRTGLIADAIHKEAGWFTIINDSFIKPDEDKLEKPDFEDMRIDLFKAVQATEVPGYLAAINAAVDADENKTLVIWLHGMADQSAKEQMDKHIKAKDWKEEDGELHALIGYGQGKHPGLKGLKKPNEEDWTARLTANKATAEKFRDALTKYNLHTLITMDNADNFRGRDPGRLNQWFLNKGYSLDKVESLQIEIREKGFREDQKQCEETAQIIVKALNEIIPAPPKEAEKPALHLLPEVVEETDERATKAFAYLKDIVRTHFHKAMLEAGKFIIKEFYGGDFERAKAKKAVNERSLRQLIQMIQRSSDGDAPKKTWIYNAVDLAVDEHMLKGVRTYGNLGLSQKVLLTGVSDMPKKKELIEETAKENYTVARLRERIREIKTPKKQKTRDLPISKPEVLFGPENEEAFNLEYLKEYPPDKLERYLEQAEENLEKINREIDRLSHISRQYDLLIEKIREAKKAQEETEAPIREVASREKITLSDRYVLLSAFQKAIRWCEVNAARYFAQKFIRIGQPGAVLNRLILIAAEDIGLADPTLIKYVRDCYNDFKSMLKKHNIKRSEVSSFPEICELIDRVVIAAALAYNSRLLPMLSFATLYDIYKKELFNIDSIEYEERFRVALRSKNEEEAVYYAYILALVLDLEERVLDLIEEANHNPNIKFISEWLQAYKDTREILMLVGAISLQCRGINYPHGEYRERISDFLPLPIEEAEIPDRAYDQHTIIGKSKGRGLKHFFEEAASIRNERFPNDWEERGKAAYLQAEKEGLQKAKLLIEAIKKKLNIPAKNNIMINLPFKYEKAVLTQTRGHKNRPFAFIIEFGDGSRKFIKGPFKTFEPAQDHLLYNEIKKKLKSQYLHPIQCELHEYGEQGIYFFCEEIGHADLSKVEERSTKADGTVKVLVYDSNDVVPDPLNYMIEINEDNRHVWVGLIVNYLFRWIFGLGDMARRNLMLERSTGKIFSTDEIFLRSSSHEDIWGGKRPAEEKFKLIKAFSESEYMNEVIEEVASWRESLDKIRREIAQIPEKEEIEVRAMRFLENPEFILGINRDLHI